MYDVLCTRIFLSVAINVDRETFLEQVATESEGDYTLTSGFRKNFSSQTFIKKIKDKYSFIPKSVTVCKEQERVKYLGIRLRCPCLRTYGTVRVPYQIPKSDITVPTGAEANQPLRPSSQNRPGQPPQHQPSTVPTSAEANQPLRPNSQNRLGQPVKNEKKKKTNGCAARTNA